MGNDRSLLDRAQECIDVSIKASPQGLSALSVVQITCAADIQPEAIRWLWDGWLARGKFHGGLSTGAKTLEGKLRSMAAMRAGWIHWRAGQIPAE